MATAIHHIVAGSNEPLVIQLYDPSDDTGSNGIDLTGITNISAKAKNVATGATVNFATCTVLGDPTNGKFILTSLVTDWATAGTYDIQIKYTDASSNVRIYPSEGNQIKLKVAGAN